MSLWSLPIRRPVATVMFFIAVGLLGFIALQRVPIELLPPVSGERLYINFSRPGSEPEVVERELLLPLEARAAELPGVEETWGEVLGSSGSFQVRFASGTDLRVRELDLRRLASELIRDQPRGTTVDVNSQDLSALSRFAMFVQVTGFSDRDSLLDLVQERIEPRLASVPGVARVLSGGAAPREVTVRIDPDRCAAMGILPDEVTLALARSVQRVRYLGGVEDEGGRAAVVLEGRPKGPISIGEIRIRPSSPVLVRHVAEVEMGAGREQILFRVNGEPTVAMVMFQDEGANLVRVGRALRSRLAELRQEFARYQLDFVVNFDAAELVEEQLSRLGRLALSGFLIALTVLFLFLRQIRAVLVVAVAVPMSLLSAMALLYLAGQSLNLITLFGLAVGIGMLVDNSIVVYEAVQRQLEHGHDPDTAAETGVRRTFRAVLAGSMTNAVVFLPLAFADFDDAVVRALLVVLAIAILLPLLGSLLVAVGLVPLLARRLAAPAALARLAEIRRRRAELEGLRPPERSAELFSGFLKTALRQPGRWVIGVVAAILATVVIAVPWVAVGTASQEPPEADSVRLSVETASGSSLERVAGLFERLESAASTIEGIQHVESVIREDGGALTVHLVDRDERPADLNAERVRGVVRAAVDELKGEGVDIEVTSADSGGGRRGGGGSQGTASLLGQGPATAVLSGPEARRLELLANEISEQLETIPEIGTTTVEGRRGQQEIRVLPDARGLQAFGLTADQVLPVLTVIRREGIELRAGFPLEDGREIPLTVRRDAPNQLATQDLERLRLSTPAGVLPLDAVADIRRMPAPPTIQHHNGRREVVVNYTLGSEAPTTGPARQDLEDQIRTAIQGVHRPSGYAVETTEADEQFDWFRAILVPVVLLLFAVLAVTFESLTLPLLVLAALPLTILGSVWALFFAGMPADYMALVGVLALIGITVNPAILLVDRMQQHAWKGGRSPGAAALAAVKERIRPVLMTATTTIAGLWPLAIPQGRENEIWPPFATVVMGGLATSTVLTLLVVPVGFVFLNRLDRLFGRLGPYVVLGWMLATAAVMTPLIRAELITSMTWQLLTTVLVAAALLGLAVIVFHRPKIHEPRQQDGPPELDVRYLHKIYGRPGPVGRAWRIPELFARRVLRRGGKPFDPRRARERILPLALVAAGAGFLAVSLQTPMWRLLFLLMASGLTGGLLREFRRARGRADEMGRVDPGGAESVLATLVPWVALSWAVTRFYATPRLAGAGPEIPAWVLIAVALLLVTAQLGRGTAQRLARGTITPRAESGWLRNARSLWRGFSRVAFGFDLPREEVHALAGAHFIARGGMVGILGPNGAGKTTLLRQLAGILKPTTGKVFLGGVALDDLRRHLGRWVGYLPQDFGLPDKLTAREYLEYYALLYEIEPEERTQRVERLLEEVGLGEKAGEPIGSYSGGMRQRVAVARTLLRLPAVIIVDEPTVGLDPRERIRFRNLLSRLAEGRVVLFSTHVVEDVAVACERTLVLSRGRVVFDGPPQSLASRAEGKVWEIVVTTDEPLELAPAAMVVDQVPLESGGHRSRVLLDERPHEVATPIEPTLEDGYLWLVSQGAPA